MGTVIKNGVAITHLNPNTGGGSSLVKIKAVDAATTPAGVTWKQGQTTITGTLEASEETKDYIVFVPSSSKVKDLYDEYVVMEENDAYSWEKLGRDIEVPEEIIWGYLFNGTFYKESTHSTAITPEAKKEYIDLTGRPNSYAWNGTAYVGIGLLPSDIVDNLASVAPDKPISARAVNVDMVNYVDGSISDTLAYVDQQDNSEHEGRVAGDNLLEGKKANKDGHYSEMTVGLAENFVPEIGDGGTFENGFLIRSSAEGESILGLAKILGLKGNVVGGAACTPATYKKVIFNQINPAQVITSATINAQGKIASGSNTIAFYRTPKCSAGDGANNGWVIEYSQAGASGNLIKVAHYAGQPVKGGAEVGTVLEKEWHRNSQSYLNESAGWIAVECSTITGLCAHIAWSGYMDGVYKAYEESIVTIPQLSKGWYGKVGRVYDEWDGEKLYNRIGKVANLASLTWDEEIVEIPPVEEGGDTTYQYIYTAPVSGMLSGSEVDSDYAGLVTDGTNLKVVSDTQLTPSTAFANKYCYYVLALATEEAGLVSGELICGDFGTEEITGTSVIPGGVTIKYDSNLRDKLRNMRAITESEIDEVFNEIFG